MRNGYPDWPKLKKVIKIKKTVLSNRLLQIFNRNQLTSIIENTITKSATVSPTPRTIR